MSLAIILMKLLTKSVDYNSTILLANITESYTKDVIFHCYWNGILTEKHLISIKSCYFFNVHMRKNKKIILWLENNNSNNYNIEIEKYAEIKYFSVAGETNNTFLEKYSFNFKNVTFYSDYIRNILLYKYGGCWFDLDCFFLKNCEPIFYNYENEICLYQWEHQNNPNNAIYISLIPFSEKMKSNMELIIERNKGWGFQEAQLTYDLPLDMLILPCSWFDGSWIKNPYISDTDEFFKYTNKEFDFDNFFKGAFCFHWHNRWEKQIEDNSILKQLVKIIDDKLANL